MTILSAYLIFHAFCAGCLFGATMVMFSREEIRDDPFRLMRMLVGLMVVAPAAIAVASAEYAFRQYRTWREARNERRIILGALKWAEQNRKTETK